MKKYEEVLHRTESQVSIRLTRGQENRAHPTYLPVKLGRCAEPHYCV